MPAGQVRKLWCALCLQAQRTVFLHGKLPSCGVLLHEGTIGNHLLSNVSAHDYLEVRSWARCINRPTTKAQCAHWLAFTGRHAVIAEPRCLALVCRSIPSTRMCCPTHSCQLPLALTPTSLPHPSVVASLTSLPKRPRRPTL